MAGLSERNQALVAGDLTWPFPKIHGREGTVLSWETIDRLLDAARDEGPALGPAILELREAGRKRSMEEWVGAGLVAGHLVHTPTTMTADNYLDASYWAGKYSSLLVAGHPQPNLNDPFAALLAASRTPMSKEPGEADTAFVRRIVAAYHKALADLEAEAGA
jgi:hypothetical protein